MGSVPSPKSCLLATMLSYLGSLYSQVNVPQDRLRAQGLLRRIDCRSYAGILDHSPAPDDFRRGSATSPSLSSKTPNKLCGFKTHKHTPVVDTTHGFTQHFLGKSAICTWDGDDDEFILRWVFYGLCMALKKWVMFSRG